MRYTARNPEALLTAEEFEKLPEPNGYRLELVQGRLVREPMPGEMHGWVTTKLAHRLHDFVERNKLGRVLTNVGVITYRSPDNVRGPDLAFISNARISASPGLSLMSVVPDLCVEILSPSNRAGRMQQKVLEYLATGARMVWVIDPMHRTAAVYRSRSDIRLLTQEDILEGDDVLPGFTLPLVDLFNV
jgi:Uma2 family endonuclease